MYLHTLFSSLLFSSLLTHWLTHDSKHNCKSHTSDKLKENEENESGQQLCLRSVQFKSPPGSFFFLVFLCCFLKKQHKKSSSMRRSARPTYPASQLSTRCCRTHLNSPHHKKTTHCFEDCWRSFHGEMTGWQCHFVALFFICLFVCLDY